MIPVPQKFWEGYNTASISPFLNKEGSMELNYANYLELKQTGITRAKIAEVFNIPDWKLKKHISKEQWGVKRPIVSNLTAFDEYSENSCYWAGFLAADGCVDSKKRIRVMLKYDDVGHLEKLKEYLKSTHTISVNTDKYNRCSFEITQPDMCDALEFNFNIVPNKTDKLEFPKHIPGQYLVHYLRGYFDGDGSICESFSNKNSITASLYATFASGSRNFSEYLFNYLQDRLKLGGHLQEFEGSTKWQLKYNTKDAITLLEHMYNNSSVHLDRKFTLYQRIVVDNIREKR
jgi:hypothetical protein